MKRIPLCAAVLLLFSLLACKNKPAASSDKRPASASDTLSDDALMDTVQRRTFQYFWEGGEPYSGMARERYHIVKISPFLFIFHHLTYIRKSLYYSVF